MRHAVALFVLLATLLAAPRALAQSAEAELTFNAGLTHLREGRLDHALDAFRRAIKQDAGNPYFYKGLSVAHTQLAEACAKDAKCRQGHLEDAVEASRKALELNPVYVDARNDLGTALLLLGKREEGRKELLAAYEDPMNPTPEISARNLGQAYAEDKNWAQALSWFRTAAQRNKTYADAQLGQADALIALGRADEATAALEAAVQASPQDPALLLGLGQAYVRAGRLADARARLEQAAARDPSGRIGKTALELLRTLPSR
jgi:tetratricopeptide (TPR) repeat protein